jgi:hypothetical protein
LKTESISAENVMGKCYVQHPSTIHDLEAWLCHMDHFYVQNYSSRPPFMTADALDELQLMDSSTLSYCEECYQEHITMLAKQEERKEPLKALELFSGSSFTFNMILNLQLYSRCWWTLNWVRGVTSCQDQMGH